MKLTPKYVPLPKVRVGAALPLAKHYDAVLFPEKLARANELLQKLSLPPQVRVAKRKA